MFEICHSQKNQTGAALLAFMLVVIVAASFTLVSKLNQAASSSYREQGTAIALSRAREALIGYAITYPDTHNNFGPGYLPCPDLDNDGDAEGSCALAGPLNRTIGRFPYETLENEELRDASGARLWYALSDNYRNNPKLEPLNSDTAGQLTLDGNNVVDFVAVIIAPGEPVGTQNRDPSETSILNEITNYLEADNSDLDVDFVTSAAGDFNDRVITITRKDLMAAVEKRVLGEVSHFLLEYKQDPDHDDGANGVDPDCPVGTPECDDIDAYPWLTPFADPKAAIGMLTGTHTGADDSTILTDSSRDFTEWGVSAGDTVVNIDDGSMGTVTAVTATTITIAGGLSSGVENDFDEDERYYVHTDIDSLANTLYGTATGGTTGTTLVDTSKEFKKLGVTPGHIVDNVTNGTSGIVETVTATRITVKSPAGVSFSVGDNYQIRTNVGVATAGSSGLILEDTNKDFVVMGIGEGDLVVNITDGSVGRVNGVNTDTLTLRQLDFGMETGIATGGSITSLVDTTRDFVSLNIGVGDTVLNISDGSSGIVTAVSATTLTLSVLTGGYNNTFVSGHSYRINRMFTQGDYYVIPRYITDNTTREGLLSFHEPGKQFKTGFTVDWNITAANGATVPPPVVSAPTVDPLYPAALVNHVEGASGTVGVDFNDGQCVWTVEQGAECTGIQSGPFLQGTVTSGTNSPYLVDATKNFNTAGIKPGDVIQNYDDTTFVNSGIADAGSGELLLVDTDVDFSPFNPAVLYNAVITRNNDLNTIGVIAEIIAGPNPGESNTVRIIGAPADAPITFSDDDTWEIRAPQRLVVAGVVANDTLFTVQTNATLPDFDGGMDEYYRILTATGNTAGTADGATAGTLLEDTAADFGNIEVGDIIENTTDGSFGRVASIDSTTTLRATLYLPTDPSITTTTTFDVGDSYTIHYDHVGTRRYEFEMKYSGTPRGAYGLNGLKKRDVCIGYENGGTPDCSAGATIAATALPANNGVPAVTITDYLDITENVAATATVTVPTVGTAMGSVKVSNLDYYLSETNGEIPRWFIKNNWHQLTYIAYSEGDSPGATVDCAEGIDCLVLNGFSTTNDKRAILIAAGQVSDTTLERDIVLDNDCSIITTPPGTRIQDRSSGNINEYYESDNCDRNDDVFQWSPFSTTFNDQVRVVDIVPP